MQAAYDKIAEDYQECLASEKRRCSLEETFFGCLGDVRDKAVLDLACGEGCVSRKIKKLGAQKVVAADISWKMLAIARQEEEKECLGVKYFCCNASQLPKVGEFDLVSAAYLLHYSKTKEELNKMCANIYANLKSGGRLVTLNLDPRNPLQPESRYDSTILSDGPLQEGSILKVTLYRNGKPTCRFENYHWEKQTYENAFGQAGFSQIRWHAIRVSQEGIAKFGLKFWENYLKQPGVIVIECIK